MIGMVYVVELGAYSDRYVAAVFTNEDQAAAYARANDGTVGHFDLDPELGEDEKRHLRPGQHAYSFSMDYDGNQAQAWEIWKDPDESLRVRVSGGKPVRLAGGCWASSEKHAIKILNEKRTGWLIGGQRVGRPTNTTSWFEAIL